MTTFRVNWNAFPDIFIVHTETTIANHSNYIDAKAGDVQSALMLVDDFVTDKFIERLYDFVKDYDDVIVLPVHAEEILGRNKIPMAYAKALQELLGFKLEVSIVQANRAYRTKSDGVGRLLKRVIFDGKVAKGCHYLIVDDVVTQGGTLADLRGYIERNGGHVIGASTLSGKPHSAKMAIRGATLGQLRKQAGKDLELWWQEQYSYDFAKFTESEARYLTKQIHRYGINAVRDTLVKARFKSSG